MKDRLYLTRDWVYRNLFVLMNLIIALGVILFAAYLVNQNTVTSRNLDATRQIIDNQASQAKKRDLNLKLLLASNDKQTRILCTLIVRNSQNFSSQDIVEIEQICQEQINQGENGDVVTNTASSSPQSYSQTNATPAPTTSQPPTTNTNTGQGGNEKTPSKPIDCSIDLLGLHIGCP